MADEIVPSTAAERVDAALPTVEITDIPGEDVEEPDDWAEPAKPAEPVDLPAPDPPPTAEPDPDSVDYQALVETMDREMAANPVNLLTNLAKTANMTETQVLELVRSLVPQGPDKILPDDYEPQGGLEPELVKRDRMDWLFKGEEKVQGLIGEATAKMAPYIDGANQEVALLRAEIEALKEVAGMTLAPDRKAIQAEVAKGTPFADAVNKVMGAQIKSEVEKAKQAMVERPTTPGSGGNDLMERRSGLPMTSYLAALKNGAKL